MEKEYSKKNEAAWNQFAYDAWCYRFGSAKDAAEKLVEAPEQKISSLLSYLGQVKGKKIINLLGSNGIKGTALALLEADVTIVDIASENKRYAMDLAREAGVSIEYIVSDVMQLEEKYITGDYDIVLMELGILHYFLDLNPLMALVYRLLKKDGMFILQDFHPVSTKLISSKGKKHKVTGDYFDTNIEESEVAYMKFVPGFNELSTEEKDLVLKAWHRKWTLGEVVTAVGSQGLFIKKLVEAEGPKEEDKGIPKLFTLVSYKY